METPLQIIKKMRETIMKHQQANGFETVFDFLNEDLDALEKLNTPVVNKHYQCDECGKVQTREEMKREVCYGYDRLCCIKCNNVLIDDLHGVVHCNVFNPKSEQKKY